MRHRQLLILFVATVALMVSGCMTGVADGKRVSSTNSTVYPAGYTSSANTTVNFEAFNFDAGRWENVKPFTSSSSRLNFGWARLNSWGSGGVRLDSKFWEEGPNGGHYARTRAKQGSTVLKNVRTDFLDCYMDAVVSRPDDSSSSTLYRVLNCFSHRSESRVYTTAYRDGEPGCDGPTSTTRDTHHGHYALDDLPICAQRFVREKMGDAIREFQIFDPITGETLNDIVHQHMIGIDHMTPSLARFREIKGVCADTRNDMGGSNLTDCAYGGFFAGHRSFIKHVSDYLRVIDYEWAPEGKLPAFVANEPLSSVWKPPVSGINLEKTMTETSFRPSDATVFDTPHRDGDFRTGVPDSHPEQEAAELQWANISLDKPRNAQADRICSSFLSDDPDPLHRAVMGYHGSGHNYVGGAMSNPWISPSNPIFFLWHTEIDLVYEDWISCNPSDRAPEFHWEEG